MLSSKNVMLVLMIIKMYVYCLGQMVVSQKQSKWVPVNLLFYMHAMFATA